jgi:hypothetical protein
MWLVNSSGEKEFRHGQEAYRQAAEEARSCRAFCPDEEDEWVAEEERSCYNCRLRRWTTASFLCMRVA